MLWVRFPLSLRNVEDLLHELGIDVSHETEWFWWHRFGPMFAAEIRKRRIEGSRDFVRHYYYCGGRAVTLLEIGHLREIAEQYAYGDGTEGAFRRLADQIADAAGAAGARSLSYDFGAPYDFGDVAFSHGDGVVRVPCGSTSRDRGDALCRNNRREFAAVHASVCKLFNAERSLSSRPHFELIRTAALAEWRGLCAE